MPKRTKVHPIKAAEKKPVERGKIHRVAMIQRSTWWDAVCRTCNAQCLCGGEGGRKFLEDWARWHASRVEIHEVDKDSDEKVEVPWGQIRTS